MALTDAGSVYGWGTFRDAGGVFGFAPGTRIQLTPALVYRPVAPDARISRIASGGAAVCGCGHLLFGGGVADGACASSQCGQQGI